MTGLGILLEATAMHTGPQSLSPLRGSAAAPGAGYVPLSAGDLCGGRHLTPSGWSGIQRWTVGGGSPVTTAAGSAGYRRRAW